MGGFRRLWVRGRLLSCLNSTIFVLTYFAKSATKNWQRYANVPFPENVPVLCVFAWTLKPISKMKAYFFLVKFCTKMKLYPQSIIRRLNFNIKFYVIF